MFLKSLTLKGFKSFAEPTTLEFERGVTVVVGPNGSGKSNVVDAVAWVLGAQGPRVVRSAKMDDVIFSGTSKRAALGRAEVSLTIDNSSQLLPIGLSEVTVTRTLFRTGESEYAINGATCRLLDVHELLSDAGVGRTQHVIIGQGQLDSILQARPEDRRAVIEEAAGVLKFRRRRERAERRLQSSEAALDRLEDLNREVHRQLKPLERQAASAMRHSALIDEERSIRLFIAGRELSALQAQLDQSAISLTQLDETESSFGSMLLADDAELTAAQAALDDVSTDTYAPMLAMAGQLLERAKGMRTRCDERRRAISAMLASLGSGSDLDRLRDEAAQVASSINQVEQAAALLLPQFEQLAAKDQELAVERQRLALAKSSSDLDLDKFVDSGRHISVAGSPEAAETSVTPVASDIADFSVQVEAGRRRAAKARSAWAGEREAEARLAERVDGLVRRKGELASQVEAAERVSGPLGAAVTAGRLASEEAQLAVSDADGDAEQIGLENMDVANELYGARARLEALEMALVEARAKAGVERLGDFEGVVGTILDVVDIADGLDQAFEAAVPAILDGVLVRQANARGAFEWFREQGFAGSIVPLGVLSGLFEPGVPNARILSESSALPAQTELLRDFVNAREPEVAQLLDRVLDNVLLCRAGFAAALDAYLLDPTRTVVTLEGERLSPDGWRLGSTGLGATRSALERARDRVVELEKDLAVVEARRVAAEAVRNDAVRAMTQASQILAHAEAEFARNERLAMEATTSLTEVVSRLEQVEASRGVAEHKLVEASRELEEAEAALVGLEREAEGHVVAATERATAASEAAAAAAMAREAERVALESLEARSRALLALRRDIEVQAASLEERRRGLLVRRDEVGSRLAQSSSQLEQNTLQRPRLEADDLALMRFGHLLDGLSQNLAEVIALLNSEVSRRSKERDALLARVRQARAQQQEHEQALAKERERRQRLEIAQAEARVRQETAIEALARDLDASPAEAIAADRPVLPPGAQPGERAREIARELRILGPVNPLAGEELVALRERATFLEGQLSDVKGARRELNQVIKAIDVEIKEVFGKAFTDVARHFADLFASLFPGGEGKLSLTAPDDLLGTGVEVEARPAGRNVRRLSLLSGGERSLVALAFLFAVFRSRPSPFYLMDEVEAALDEVNLRRFLTLVGEFRDEAQLIIVSHQKRTMEIADSLFGITMQPGGSSKAVSERVRQTVDRPTNPSSPPQVDETNLAGLAEVASEPAEVR